MLGYITTATSYSNTKYFITKIPIYKKCSKFSIIQEIFGFNCVLNASEPTWYLDKFVMS